ncbi:unnamed protein product [Adineta steineri]|uniref:Microbial-type PARG catalytic domain-containing protein n=1 Tax=Adineta steineri TaxID=433720 RepID=A0A815BU23_9BILA|nr:unnamed protein product [Adineta steineri]CAF1559081.1 unnamed protein product [Adineta steineri]
MSTRRDKTSQQPDKEDKQRVRTPANERDDHSPSGDRLIIDQGSDEDCDAANNREQSEEPNRSSASLYPKIPFRKCSNCGASNMHNENADQTGETLQEHHDNASTILQTHIPASNELPTSSTSQNMSQTNFNKGQSSVNENAPRSIDSESIPSISTKTSITHNKPPPVKIRRSIISIVEFDTASQDDSSTANEIELSKPSLASVAEVRDGEEDNNTTDNSGSPIGAIQPRRKNQSSSTHYSHDDIKQNDSHPPMFATQSNNELSSEDEAYIAYIPHLPSNEVTDQELETIIRHTLDRQYKLHVIDIKCNSQFDVGVMYLKNKEDKDKLVNTICQTSITLNSDETISFTNEFELDVYVVVTSKDNSDLPRSKHVRQQWMQIYNGNSPLKCKRLSSQFPNIFKIIIDKVEELFTITSVKEFQIEHQTAIVYYHADCCFFDTVPQHITEKDLYAAIFKEISPVNRSKTRIHVSLDIQEGSAVALICNSSVRCTSINLDGKVFKRKDRLSYFLRLHSVPSHILPTHIEAQEIFNGTIIKIEPSDNDIIVELSSKSVYEKCLEQRVLRMDNHTINITSNSYSSKNTDDDINNVNWYETEMLDGKSNIMQFFTQPEHRIFGLKWDCQAFLDQFHGRSSENNNHQETISNEKRHSLRMTVMLNTIGIVEKGNYSIDNKKIQLKPNQLNTIVYDHQSKLQQEITLSSSIGIDYPYESTSVQVINEDCLIVHEQLLSRGYNPLLLNMANAYSPGGGYRKGDGAQEENIFRRSDYYRSLDIELDAGQPTPRFYCTSRCQLEQLTTNQKMYPMDEYGAIYTSGLTVFRQPEDTGYAFMEQPMFNVCAIAIAAYRNPKLDHKSFLTSKYMIGTRKKIETIFAIAKHHKHDCLVLSAFGCGAFRNPPKHIALIFKSVIEQYAGFFRKICFAIIDDHNTGQDLNPHGNYRPFQDILHNLKVKPMRHITVNMMIGPWRILNIANNKEINLSDVKICDLSPCHYGGQCRDLENNQHCQKYLHPPLCPLMDSSGICQLNNDDDHMILFTHRIKHSNASNSRNDDHSLLPVCPWTPFHCRQYILLSESTNIASLSSDVQNHCREFRHICRFGRQCHETSRLHRETTIHIARDICPDGNNCSKINQENHLYSFTHLGIADIRRLCYYIGSECSDRDQIKHLTRYRHRGNYDHSSVIPYNGLNKEIVFIQNQQEIITTIHRYAESLKFKTPLSISRSIIKCMQSLSPIYQCSKELFELILLHGHVMSTEYIKQLMDSRVVIQTIQQNKFIQKIIISNQNQANEDHINNYIQAISCAEFNKRLQRSSSSSPEENFNDTIRTEEKFLKSILTRNEIDKIRDFTIQMIDAVLNLSKNIDDAFEKHITAILAPNLHHNVEDIVLVFKRDVLYHPDANVSIQSKNSFLDGTTFIERPWIKDSGTSKKRLEQFHKSLLHCSIQGYDYALASELLAITGKTKKTMDMDLNTILTYMKCTSSNQLFECHLPELIHLDYIEEIYIPHTLYTSLSSAAQLSAKTIFGDSLHITPRNVNQYQDYVKDDLMKKLIKNIEQEVSLCGSIITLPPSHLKKYTILPFTLADDSVSDDIFIYWQSMYGDMMLVLSNEPIDTCNISRSLLCYIAETPSTTINDYCESFSYLNFDDPLQHETIMNKRSFLASSSTFHRGCNLDDYLTYCLKLKKSTDEVTLTHAGPNSIYNDEKISYKFIKSDLDLNELVYVQISANSQQVPIRNFMVCFKPLHDLHPHFEKDFQPTNSSSNQSRAHQLNRPHSPPIPRNDKPSNVFSQRAHSDRSKLSLCRDSVNCLRQTSNDHCKRYSHPCRFSEVCLNKDNEPHLTHEVRRVEKCPLDKSCKRLGDPYHRAEYRHTDLPDFLFPCRDQTHCAQRSAEHHRIKYSHGEQVNISSSSNASRNDHATPTEQTPCRYGSRCRDQHNPQHCSKYSHSSGQQPLSQRFDE